MPGTIVNDIKHLTLSCKVLFNVEFIESQSELNYVVNYRSNNVNHHAPQAGHYHEGKRLELSFDASITRCRPDCSGCTFFTKGKEQGDGLFQKEKSGETVCSKRKRAGRRSVRRK